MVCAWGLCFQNFILQSNIVTFRHGYGMSMSVFFIRRNRPRRLFLPFERPVDPLPAYLPGADRLLLQLHMLLFL